MLPCRSLPAEYGGRGAQKVTTAMGYRSSGQRAQRHELLTRLNIADFPDFWVLAPGSRLQAAHWEALRMFVRSLCCGELRRERDDEERRTARRTSASPAARERVLFFGAPHLLPSKRLAMKRTHMHSHRHRRMTSGSVLVEFALVALVLYLLLAATIEFGRAFYCSQVLQAAADVAARELARTPLPPNLSFEEALQWEDLPGSGIRPARRIYDPHYLVLDLDTLGGRATLMDLVADLPPVNQQLFPLMIYTEYEGRRLLRYPGALLLDADPSDDPVDPPPSGLLVAVPVVAARDAQGRETIRWVDVVEDLQASDEAAPPGDVLDPFNLLSPQRGLVALRINYAFQAATMSSFDNMRDGDPEDPNINEPNLADDSSVVELNVPAGTPVAPDAPAGGLPGTYGGLYGLGGQGALNSPLLAAGFPVRPFRRVLVGQAIARREVFSP